MNKKLSIIFIGLGFLFLLNATSLLGPRSRPRFALVLPPAQDLTAVALWLEFAAALRGDAKLFPKLVSWSTGVGTGWHDGLAVDACGNVYMCDYNVTAIYRITPDGR